MTPERGKRLRKWWSARPAQQRHFLEALIGVGVLWLAFGYEIAVLVGLAFIASIVWTLRAKDRRGDTDE